MSKGVSVDRAGHPAGKRRSSCTECSGISINDRHYCINHCDPSSRDSVLEKFSDGGDLWFTEGISIGRDLWQRVLEQSPKVGKGRILNNARFDGAVFEAGVNAAGGSSLGRELIFSGTASFRRTVFQDYNDFAWTDFRDGADFSGAEFRRGVRFFYCEFGRFSLASDESITNDPTLLRMMAATTERWWSAMFDGAVFPGGLTVSECTFDGVLSLDGIFAGSAATLGTLHAPEISIQNSRFTERVRLDLHGVIGKERNAPVVLRSVIFESGATMSAIACDLEFDEVEFNRSSLISKASPRIDWKDRYGIGSSETPKPRLIVLSDCDLGDSVSVADTDISFCVFPQTTNLDKIRLAAGTNFFRLTSRFHAKRQIIAEECLWRHVLDRRWPGPTGRYPSSASHGGLRGSYKKSSDAAGSEALRIAGVYRALRKSREEGKDEPGAADLYYGEMEMRRLSSHTPRAERILINGYWAFSGYGLRASRALLALATMIFLGTVGFSGWGFAADQTWTESLLYVIHASTSLVNIAPKDIELTMAGEVGTIFLRLAGPLLLGLAVLAIRGRVKR